MKDMAMHVLDLIENSAKAGAPTATVVFSWHGSWLRLDIFDDGPGLPAAVIADPTDPYRTTRTERKVGLGLSFLRQSAEATGGSLRIASQPGNGVSLRAEMNLASIDARPLGDLVDALTTAAIAWPSLALVVRVGSPEACLDMGDVKRELAGLPLSHPAVRGYIRQSLEEGLAPLYRWAENPA